VQLLLISHLPNIRGSPFFRSAIVIDASTLHISSTYRYIFISQTCIADINTLLQSENIHFINHALFTKKLIFLFFRFYMGGVIEGFFFSRKERPKLISHLPNIRGSPFFRSAIVIDASTLYISSTYRYIFISQTCIADIINLLIPATEYLFIDYCITNTCTHLYKHIYIY
jgi:hypothetical protein